MAGGADTGADRTGAHRGGTAHELISLALLAGLEQAGIRALVLKGSILARQLYDDPGARTAGDIDILVAAADLDPAIAVVSRWAGSTSETHLARRGSRCCMRTLARPQLPRVELHWRVHWYETQFAADALARAERPGAHRPLVMQPADGLAALMLFYARDGFLGLRLAADVADVVGPAVRRGGSGPVIAATVATPTRVGRPAGGRGHAAARPGGASDEFGPARVRWRLAAQLATPFPDLEPAQILANASLVDLLLAPRGPSRRRVARELQKIPKDLERPLRVQGRAERLSRALGAFAAYVASLGDRSGSGDRSSQAAERDACGGARP